MVKKSIFTASAVPVIAGMILFVQTAAAQQAELRVISSNGIKGALDKLLPEYEKTSHQRVTIQYGGTAGLKRDIEGGAQFDLAILTPVAIDDLTRQGKIAGASTAIAKANLAVGIRTGSPKADISTPDAIKRRLLAAKSITYSKEGAATPAIAEMVSQLGIADQLKAKTVFQEVSGRAQESVAEGENELVLAPLSEIVGVKGIEVLGLFPKEFQKPLIMSAGVGAKPANPEAAHALIKFLTSPGAAQAIKASGMEMAKGK
jgi:molybdate transport system substrate-binding protein